MARAGWAETAAGIRYIDENGHQHAQKPEPVAQESRAPAPIDSTRELGGTERARFALAADKPATQIDALNRLGYDAEEVDGEVIATDRKTGQRFRPDSKDWNWKDALDLPAMIPEAVGQTVGGLVGLASPVPGGTYAGQAAGSGIGTFARQKAAQYFGVEDPNRDWKDRAMDIGVSTAVGGLAPLALEKAAIPAIRSAATKVAAKIPSLPKIGIAAKAKDAMIEQTFGVRAPLVREVMAEGGEKIAAQAARSENIPKAHALRIAQAPAHIMNVARQNYENAMEEAIGLDTLVNEKPIVDYLSAAIRATDTKHAGGKIGTSLTEADRPLVEAWRNRANQIAEDATENLVDAARIKQLRLTLDDELANRGVYDGSAKVTQADRILLGLRGKLTEALESAAERSGSKDAWKAANTEYRRATLFAKDLGRTFNIAFDKVGDQLVPRKAADVDRVTGVLSNIENVGKDSRKGLLEALRRDYPDFADDVDGVFLEAKAKPFRASDVSTTGKTNNPILAAATGFGIGSATPLGPLVGGPIGAGVALTANAARSPQAAIQYLPQIGQLSRDIGSKKAAAIAATKRGAQVYALPPIRSLAAIAAPRGAAMEVQARIPSIGPSIANIKDNPRELMGEKWAQAQNIVAEAHGPRIKSLVDAGATPEQATDEVMRDLVTKYRADPKKLTGRFAQVVQGVRQAVKEQYGQDITKAQALEILARDYGEN